MEKTENTDFTVPGSCSSCWSLDLPQDSSRAQSVHQSCTSTVMDNKMNTGPTLVKDCIVSEVYVEKPESTENEGTFDFSLPGSAMSYIITSHRSPSTSPMSPLSTADDLVLSEEIDQLLSGYVPMALEETSDVLPVLPDSFVQELLEEAEHEAEKQPEKMAASWKGLKMRKTKVVPLSCGKPCSQPEAKGDTTSSHSSLKMKEFLMVADKRKQQVNTCTCPNQTKPIPDHLFSGASETNLQNMETACNSFKEDSGNARPPSAQGSKPRKDTGSKRTSLWNFFKGLTKKRSKTSDNLTGPSESDYISSDDNNNTGFSWRGLFAKGKENARSWFKRNNGKIGWTVGGGIVIAVALLFII